MSTVAWDGKAIAADKQCTCAGLRSTTTKIRRIATGEVLAWTGDQDSGGMVAAWYEDGADPAKWPDCQKGDTWSRLIVAGPAGVRIYERQPVASMVEDAFMAWGSGRDFALAALHCGKTASEAVEIASIFDCSTGMGIDTLRLPL